MNLTGTGGEIYAWSGRVQLLHVHKCGQERKVEKK